MHYTSNLGRSMQLPARTIASPRPTVRPTRQPSVEIKQELKEPVVGKPNGDAACFVSYSEKDPASATKEPEALEKRLNEVHSSEKIPTVEISAAKEIAEKTKVVF